MAKKTPVTSTTPGAPKKARKRNAQYYFVKVSTEDNPMLVLATDARKALAAIIIMRPALPQDILEAGKNGWDITDATTPVSTMPDASPIDVEPA